MNKMIINIEKWVIPAVVGLLTNDNYVQDFDVGENTNVGFIICG